MANVLFRQCSKPGVFNIIAKMHVDFPVLRTSFTSVQAIYTCLWTQSSQFWKRTGKNTEIGNAVNDICIQKYALQRPGSHSWLHPLHSLVKWQGLRVSLRINDTFNVKWDGIGRKKMRITNIEWMKQLTKTWMGQSLIRQVQLSAMF